MKRFAMWVVVPLVVIAGAVFASPGQAEAGHWGWRTGAYYYAPRHVTYVERYRPRPYGGYYWAAPTVTLRVQRPIVVYSPMYGYYTTRPYAACYGEHPQGYWW